MGQLNPDWVEWLMGWPISWSSLEPITELLWLDWSVDPADMEPSPMLPTPCTSDCDHGHQGTWSTTGLNLHNYALGKGKQSPKWRTPAQQEPGITAKRLRPIEGGELGGMNRHFDKETGRMAQIGTTQQATLRGPGVGPIPRVATGIKDRVNRLKAIGNGMVPQCVAVAWKVLISPSAHGGMRGLGTKGGDRAWKKPR